MLPVQLCIDQIPAGAHAPQSPGPRVSVSPFSPPQHQISPPPGLYVRAATHLNPADAIRASLEFVQRLGTDRPSFMRGLRVRDGDGVTIEMFGGPFPDRAAAQAFCARALAGQVCVVREFSAASG